MNSVTQRRIRHDYGPPLNPYGLLSDFDWYAKMKKKPPRIRICDIWYDIVYANEEEEPELVGAEGLCDHKNCRIVIKEGIDPKRLKNVFVHEVLHGLINESGVRNEIETVARKDADEWEERVVRMLTPHLCDLLEQLK